MNTQQQLNALARARKVPYNQLLTHYVMERFLYRLSRSVYAEKLILKGGMLLMGLGANPARTTMDIDLLGHISNSPKDMQIVIRNILHTKIGASDDIQFSDSIQCTEIMREAKYTGVNIEVQARVCGDPCVLSIDIGFNDIIYPAANVIDYPPLLQGSPSAKVLCYPKEAVVAEKLESIVHLSSFNTRMKDFYDLWFLSNSCKFDPLRLRQSIHVTFHHRGTPLQACLILREESYTSIMQPRWAGYVAKLKASTFKVCPPSVLPSKFFSDVTGEISAWIFPVLELDCTDK